jgi:SPP1 gp7 family putative phage head morphogenesis protein
MANKFSIAASTERKFATELRKVAKIVAGIINPHVHGEKLADPAKMSQALKAYSDILGPWAERITATLIENVSKANKRAFETSSKKMGASLRTMTVETSVGSVVKMLQTRQVELIKSLPLEAGLRAQDLALQAAVGGKRADEVAAALADTEGVTLSRATLIARTEIAKANAAITQARAEYVGATHYIWQTAEDGDVRDSHAAMEGKIFRFDHPPTLEDGMTGNAGEFPNCRCFAEPIIPV